MCNLILGVAKLNERLSYGGRVLRWLVGLTLRAHARVQMRITAQMCKALSHEPSPVEHLLWGSAGSREGHARGWRA